MLDAGKVMDSDKLLKKELLEAYAKVVELQSQIERAAEGNRYITGNRSLTYLDYETINKEIFLSRMHYKVHTMPNSDKSIFHDALKGFEEYSKLKGYVVLLSIDTSLDNKVAYKFDFQTGSSYWSRNKIRDDLKDYLNRIKLNQGIDDIYAECTRLQEVQLKSTLRNRMSLIQHAFESQKSVYGAEVKKGEAKLEKKKKKIYKLEKKLSRISNEKNRSIEEKAALEIELSSKRVECEMLINDGVTKDSVIDHLKESISISLSEDKNVLNIENIGNFNMCEYKNRIDANHSNIMLDSPYATQTLEQSNKIDTILSQIIEQSKADPSITKSEYIDITSGVEIIQSELVSSTPNISKVERSLSNLGSVASITSLATQLSSQLAPFLSSSFM